MPDASSTSRPLLLGHRGARARRTIPENSTASFDQCLSDGCDGFEFDVRLTADGIVVVCHDAKFEGIEIAVASGNQLPGLARLEDVLGRYQQRAFLDIELKVGGIEKETVSLLRRIPPRRGFVVSSFLPEVLRAMREQDSDVPLGLICETSAEVRGWDRLPVEYVIPHYKLASSVFISEIRAAGKDVLVWTVNDSARMRRFRELGVDGIISDDTDLLCRILGGAEKPHGG